MDAYRERVEKQRGFKGIDTHIALSLVCEIGDFSRFATAAQFSAYLGLVPSENSSRQRERRGGITKGGTTRLRALLTEAANGATRGNLYGAKSKKLKARQAGNTAMKEERTWLLQKPTLLGKNPITLSGILNNRSLLHGFQNRYQIFFGRHVDSSFKEFNAEGATHNR